jgi:hypothetical protein
MKKAFGMAMVSAALAIACVQSAQALDSTGTFRGAILVTDITDQCDLPGFPRLGQTLLAVFRPEAPSAPPAALLVTFANGALLVTPVGSPPPPSGQYGGDLIGGVATYSHYTGGTYVINVKPSDIVPTTQQVTLTGKITKFRNTTGCTVNFKGSFFRGVV